MRTGPNLDELIHLEAQVLAREVLARELAAQGLPLPKDPAIHVDQLISAQPNLVALARERVLARKDAHSESFRAIGLNLPELPLVVDLDL